MAAAMPPSAITVCALPSRDLHTTPTEAPAAEAAIAARRPAPPAPMIRTSCSCVSKLPIISAPEVPVREAAAPESACCHKTDIDIGEHDREERNPGPVAVPRIQKAHEPPHPTPRSAAAHAREAVDVAAHEMSKRMAGSGVEGNEHDIGQHDQGAN